MKNFQFYNPTEIILGKDTINQIGQAISKHKVQKVLLIAGGGSIKRNGVYDQTIASLKEAGIDWVVAWGIRPNPVISRVRELIKLAGEEKVEAVLAVGGGSVIDTAKAVAAGMFVEDPWILFERRLNTTDALPVFTILTISATGSEFDAGGVITNEEENKKWFFMCPAVAPKVSIIDPSVQVTLPWYQTVNGSVDAMAHIMEPYFVGGDNEVTQGIIESLLKSIVKLTNRLQKNQNDYEARAGIAWAAALALSGIPQAGQGFADSTPHALEHAISAYNHTVSHGAGLAVTYPAWISYCHDANPKQFERWAKNVWEVNTVEEAIHKFKDQIKAWGHPTTLKELGVNEEQIGDIAQNAFDFGLPTIVKKLGTDEMEEILRAAWE